MTRCVVIFSCIYVVTFKPMPHLTSPCLLLSLLLSFLCQAGMSMETLLDSSWGNRSKKPTWTSGFSQVTTLPTNKELRNSLCSYTALATQITYVMIILQHPDHRDSPILFPGNLRGSKIRPTFGNELRHHCLLYGPDATSFIRDSSVPFLSAWNCPFQVMKSCQATKILSPQEQINLPRGSRWTLTRSWYITWLMFKKLPQTFARHQKRGLLHLLRQTVSANIF